MVILFGSPWTAMDQRTSSGLPMTGEDTGLGALASPMAGYLGKVHERTVSLESCPWCTSKGLTFSLRSYRINLQESITLCTNPQCLFPLVSRPLEDILASLVPAEPTTRSKRKNALALETEEPNPAKRQRLDESGGPEPLVFTETHTGQEACGEKSVVHNGQHTAIQTDGGNENGDRRTQPVLEGKPENGAGPDDSLSTSAEHLQNSPSPSAADGEEPPCSPHHEDLCTSEVESDSGPATDTAESPRQRIVPDSDRSQLTNKEAHASEICGPSLQEEGVTAGTEKETIATDAANCEDAKLETIGLSFTPETPSAEPAPLVSPPFWGNRDNLCWLDSLLVVLVNCKSLETNKPKDEPRKSAVWRLTREYENACAALQIRQQSRRDGSVRVPSHALQDVNTNLHALRMSIFKQLQPQLHCKLGQRETPVFALPLLLAMDSWAEPLFRSSFRWEFSCSGCKIFTKERVVKTLPTFTNIMPDWCPLQAAHLAPCNACGRRDQRRAMILERVPAVFALHFVEGLPDSDVGIYSFAFGGRRYSITSVIQYDQHTKHFVPWIRQSDGSWLEFDDLKHPDCKTHRTFPVPAHEMHMVFWEAEEAEPSACSPTNVFAELQKLCRDEAAPASEATPCTPDQSLLVSLVDDDNSAMDVTITGAADTSIGSTTLLDTFEGLSHDDIIMLTLTEVEGPEAQPLGNSEPTGELPSCNEILEPSLDSSSVVSGSEMSRDAFLPKTSSDESCGESSDPTYVPAAEKTQGRGKRAAKTAPKQQKGRRAAKTKAASTSSEPAPVTAHTCVRDAQPAKAAKPASKPASPASSTNASPESSSQPTPLDQSARWFHLLSKQPHNQAQKSSPQPTQPKPPSHSTPNSARRPPVPAAHYPRPHLRTEDSEGLPLKAAERYDGFSAKSSSAPRLPAPPLFPQGTANGTAAPAPSLPLLGGSRQTSKVPTGLSETEALRYKLLKKLKAKKKKLAKLNAMLSQQGEVGPRPDSTDLGSPGTVTSSTYDGSNCDELLSDLLSPATTASNLSPDSSGFLDVLTSRQDGVDHLEDRGYSGPHGNTFITPSSENFLEEFMAEAAAHQPTEMEKEALGALDLFF